MSYCVNCGVHLKDDATKCPLCRTIVINPSQKMKVASKQVESQLSEQAYQQTFDKSLWTKLMSITLLAPASISILINWVFQHEITWSRYVAVSLFFVWVWMITPFIFSRAHFLKWVPIGAASQLIFLYLIEMFSNTIGWFYPIALPITLALFSIMTAIYLLITKKKVKELQIPATILISIGIFCVIINSAINLYFHQTIRADWSLIVLTACFAFAMVAFVLQQRPWIVEELKHWFRI